MIHGAAASATEQPLSPCLFRQPVVRGRRLFILTEDGVWYNMWPLDFLIGQEGNRYDETFRYEVIARCGGGRSRKPRYDVRWL